MVIRLIYLSNRNPHTGKTSLLKWPQGHELAVMTWCINTLRARQNGRHFPDDIFKCIFLNENVWISIKIPVKFVPKGPINNIPALFQIMAWRRPGDKPLFETMMVTLLTHICVTRPQWVNGVWTRFQCKEHLSRLRDLHYKDETILVS